jgi:hypothetical protein
MGSDIQIFVILKEDAEEHKRRAINKLSSMVQKFFDDGIMERTLEAMAEKPLLGEPTGNCHNIVLGFMTDLIIAGRGQGWFWVEGVNKNRNWQHSWLEYGDFVVDATEKQKEKPDQLTVSIGEVGYAYKAKGITKILKRRDAAQTRRWIFRQAKDEA